MRLSSRDWEFKRSIDEFEKVLTLLYARRDPLRQLQPNSGCWHARLEVRQVVTDIALVGDKRRLIFTALHCMKKTSQAWLIDWLIFSVASAVLGCRFFGLHGLLADWLTRSRRVVGKECRN
jgi:hypothetical protein